VQLLKHSFEFIVSVIMLYGNCTEHKQKLIFIMISRC